MTRVAVTNTLAFLDANVLKLKQSYEAVMRLRIVATSIPGHVSGWRGHGEFESHSQPFLLT